MSHTALVRGLLAVTTLAFAGSAIGATPASGVLSPDVRSLSFTGGPFPVPNVTPQLYAEGLSDPVCTPGEGLICDDFALSLNLPEDFFTTNPQDLVKITMTWEMTAGVEDYDFYLYDSSGAIVNQGEGTTNPETITFCAGQGIQEYKIIVYPFSAVSATYTVNAELVTEPKARCKAPKSAAATASKSDVRYGGAFGLALLAPLFAFALRRRA